MKKSAHLGVLALVACLSLPLAAQSSPITAYSTNHLDAAPGLPSLVPTFAPATATWTWSSSLVQAANVVRITPVGGLGVHPTVEVDSAGKPRSVAFRLPVVSITAERLGPDQVLTVVSEQLAGQIKLQTTDNAATKGTGEWVLSDLSIDLVNKQVTALVPFAGVELGRSNDRIAIFDFDASPFLLDPATDLIPVLTCLPSNPSCISGIRSLDQHPALNNLRLTQDAFTVMSKQLQLNEVGKVAIQSVTGRPGAFGDITVSQVPEPSSWAMLGMGLIGLGLARRRATHG